MLVNELVRSWYEGVGKELIKKYCIDADGIYSSDKGLKKGVYAAYIVMPDGRELLFYIGEVGKEGRGFRDRVTEHLRHWINNPEHFIGVKRGELICDYKIKVCIVALENNEEKRYELEQRFIAEKKPFLQFSCFPKFKTEDYNGWDLCIRHSYRRSAFLLARDGSLAKEEQAILLEKIYTIAEDIDFNAYKDRNAAVVLKEVVEQEMPRGSEQHRLVKAYVEKRMGITSPRGLQYPYLVNIVAAILEDDK